MRCCSHWKRCGRNGRSAHDSRISARCSGSPSGTSVTEMAAKAAKALLDAADAPTMMVRPVGTMQSPSHCCCFVSVNPLLLSEIASGLDLDGDVLQAGDYVLLTQQTNATENGVWVVGKKAEETQRPMLGRVTTDAPHQPRAELSQRPGSRLLRHWGPRGLAQTTGRPLLVKRISGNVLRLRHRHGTQSGAFTARRSRPHRRKGLHRTAAGRGARCPCNAVGSPHHRRG